MLKRISLVVGLLYCLYFVGISKSNAYSGNGFIWNKTEITIPINSNFLDYLNEFEVKFYYNGEITNEAVKVEMDDFYYGDLTVSTSKPETKTVKLIATVSGYSNYDKKDIIVHIKDNISPTISLLQPLIFPIGKPVNYNEYFKCKDNYGILSTIYNDTNVNYTVLGVYELKVIVTDLDGNVVETKFNVNIVDKQKPSINTASFIEVVYGNLDFDITDYVKASDDLDGDITSNVKVSGLDVYKLGDQIVDITVSDSSGNVTTVTKTIKVVDYTAPILELSTYYDTIYINDINIDFKKYISKVYDECEELSIDDVEIDASDFSNTYGSHKVIYKIKDRNLNYTLRTLTINVTYQEGPVISANDLSFEQNEIFNLKDYINVLDQYDESVIDNYTIYDDTLDSTKPGKYEIVIEASNKAGVTTQKVIYVTITASDTVINSKFDDVIKYVYDNKVTIAIVIVGLSGLGIYYSYRKKTNKKGE